MIKDVQNVKFDPHLQLLDCGEFERAKFKIRMLYLEKRENKLKLKKYRELFSIKEDDLEMLGIMNGTLKNFEKQFL